MEPLSSSHVPPVDFRSLARGFLVRKDAQAERLAAALRFQSISFESPDGTPASLIGSTSATRAPPGGCACCNEVADAIPRDDRVVPSPAALDVSRAAFLGLHALLQTSFPRMHGVGGLERHVVNTYSLAYIWRPRSGAPSRRGFALAAHLDVVPVPDAAQWEHPPFSGFVAGGWVHGRGAVDDKHSLFAICEAVEALLEVGWAPSCAIVLCFGHDEELGGTDGAQAIAAALPRLLGSCGSGAPPLTFMLDEGLFLLEGLVPGLRERVAVVCIGEKGHVNVEVSVSAPAGHSSVPPASSAIGVLARAITAIETTRAPVFLNPGLRLFTTLLPLLPAAMRILFGHSWLTAPLLRAALLRTPATAAMVRTSTAVTMVNGGLKSNVMPPLASCIVNHRIHPAESVADVVARDAAAVHGLPGVSITAREALEPSPVSSTSSAAWESVRSALMATNAELDASRPIAVAPGLMLGNTDTRHYWGLCDDIYRHCPTELTMAETSRFHGRNEKVSVDNLARLASFYAAVMLRAGGST